MIGDGLLRVATGSDEFALPAHHVCHVARFDQLRVDPAPDGRVGALMLGGRPVPVFDLRVALGLEARARSTGDSHIAVTGCEGDRVGWLVDRITRETDGTEMQVAALPRCMGGRARHWFQGVALHRDGRAWLLIDPAVLNPLRAQAPLEPAAAVSDVASPRPGARGSSEAPVALVFSTPVLPETGIGKFALSGRQVAAIVQPEDSLAVPGSAPHIAGLRLWRDAVVPIVDFRRSRHADASRYRQLIARCSADAASLVALTIDADVVMHRPTPEDALVWDVPCPAFASGVFDLSGDRVALLDLNALVNGGA